MDKRSVLAIRESENNNCPYKSLIVPIFMGDKRILKLIISKKNTDNKCFKNCTRH